VQGAVENFGQERPHITIIKRVNARNSAGGEGIGGAGDGNTKTKKVKSLSGFFHQESTESAHELLTVSQGRDRIGQVGVGNNYLDRQAVVKKEVDEPFHEGGAAYAGQQPVVLRLTDNIFQCGKRGRERVVD
jgi:hypothetical protein